MAKNAKEPDAAVICTNCGKEIPFVKPKMRTMEFSFNCPHCNRRKIYTLADIRPFVPKKA
jgi:predicted RNA-binding Zn-ribbon protein involved in translation (DUF1610 family)